MTLEELRRQIGTAQLPIECSHNIIATGLLSHVCGKQAEYVVRYGWDIVAANECDHTWTQATIELMSHIDEQNYDDHQLSEVLGSIQAEDNHWDWFMKSALHKSDEYGWFFLYCEGKPQGACLIYHPKRSALTTDNIFYVEYLAVAPWNRDCLIRRREYKGVGSTLLKAVLRYAVDNLGLTPGFSLHSLPQATEYYEKLRMLNIAQLNKQSLVYYELPSTEANKLLEAV